MSEDLPLFTALTAAGGNSRLARSARAKLQFRDRFGRWVEMGRGVKFKIRFPDGSTRSVIGPFVGAVDTETGQVYIDKDPNGLPSGFYQVKSANAQEVIADLSVAQLKARGIDTTIKSDSRLSADVPALSEIKRTDAPEGWKKLDGTYGGKNVIETEDGDFRVHFGGKDNNWIVEDTRAGGGRGVAYKDAGQAFEKVGSIDEGRLDTDAPETDRTRDDIVDALKLNDRTLANERASLDAKQRAMTQNAQLNKELADSGFDPYNPEGKDSDEQIAARKAAAPATGTDTPETTLEPQTGVQPSPEGIDTDTFGVERSGFLVPTGKSTQDISAEGLALHIEAEKDHYAEGGKRLVVDTDASVAEGYNSAETFEDAKAQAGGVGATSVIDLAAGKTEQVDAPDNVDTSGTGEGDNNAKVRNPDAGEPQGAEPRGDSPDGNSVDSPDATDKPEPGDDNLNPDPNRVAAGVYRKPAEVRSERNDLAAERKRNQDALARTGNRSAMDQIAKRLEEIETRLGELDQEDTDRDKAAQAAAPSPAPDEANANAPEAGSVEELQARRSQLNAALETSGDPKDIIALNDQINALDTRIKAQSAKPEQAPDDATPDSDTPVEDDEAVRPADADEIINGLTKLDEGRPDDLTRPEVDALDVENAGWEDVMFDDGGRDEKYDGLNPDQIAGEAPVVNGQPDFYAETPEAQRAYDQVTAFLEDPDRTGGMFEGLSLAEIDAFKEASAKDRAWINAYNTWNVEDQPEWRGADGRSAVYTRASILALPTKDERVEATKALYAGMDNYERKVYDRDIDNHIENRSVPDAPLDVDPEAVPVRAPEPAPEVDEPNAAAEFREEDAWDRIMQTPTESRQIGMSPAAQRQQAEREQAWQSAKTVEERAALIHEMRQSDEIQWAANNPRFSREVSVREVVKNQLPGKAFSDDQKRDIESVLNDPGSSHEELQAIRTVVEDAPNAENTNTKPRTMDRPPRPERPAANDNDDPFDILWQGVLDAFPNAQLSPEGDLIIDTIQDFHAPIKRNARQFKNYELRIRRTNRNTAFVYVLETDTKTGERKALRMSPETHSWDTFAGRVHRAQVAFKNPKLHITVSRSDNTEHLGKNRDVGENPLRDYLERGVRPDGPDAVFNAVANAVIDRLTAGEQFGSIVDQLRKLEGVDTDTVNRVAQSFIAQMMEGNVKNFKPRDVHTSWNGKKVQEGDRFEWTDHRRYLDWYKPTMRENPDYGKVYRGTVIKLKDEHSDGKGRRYGDDLVIQFDAGQKKNTNQGTLAAQSIRVIDDDNAPLGEPFEAKRNELATPEAIAKAFNVPQPPPEAAKAEVPRSVPVPSAPRPAPVRKLSIVKVDPQTNYPSGYGVRVPYDALQAAEWLETAEKTNKSADEMKPGDMFFKLNPDNTTTIYTLLSRTSNGGIIAAKSDHGNAQIERHEPGAFDYMVAVPNQEIVETPDYVQEGYVVSFEAEGLAFGSRGFVLSVGNGFAIVEGSFTKGPIRVPFDQITEGSPDPLSAERLELLERLDEAAISEENKSKARKYLLNTTGGENTLDRVAQIINGSPVIKGKIAGMGTLLGSVGLPRRTLDRLLSRLALPEVPTSVVRKRSSKLSGNYHKDVTALHYNPDYAVLEAPGLSGIQLGDKMMIEDNSGNKALATLITKDDLDQTVILESLETPRFWWGAWRVGQSANIPLRSSQIIRVYRPNAAATAAEISTENIDVSPNIRRSVEDMKANFKDLIERFKSGWDVVFVPGEGAVHDVGQIVAPKNGKGNIFMKRAGSEGLPEYDQKEFLALAIANAIGITTVHGAYDTETKTFLMNAVDGDLAYRAREHDDRAQADIFNSYGMWRMGLLDKLIGNGDRHNQNYMFDKAGNLYPIDHGLANFSINPRDTRIAALFNDRIASGPISSAEYLRIRNAIAALLPFFETFGQRQWYDNVLTNMEAVVQRKAESE